MLLAAVMVWLLRTTFHNVYTGVEWPDVLPAVALEDKKKIHTLNGPDTSHLPKNWDRAGLPLFWQESKSPALWRQLMQDLKVPWQQMLAQALLLLLAAF